MCACTTHGFCRAGNSTQVLIRARQALYLLSHMSPFLAILFYIPLHVEPQAYLNNKWIIDILEINVGSLKENKDLRDDPFCPHVYSGGSSSQISSVSHTVSAPGVSCPDT